MNDYSIKQLQKELEKVGKKWIIKYIDVYYSYDMKIAILAKINPNDISTRKELKKEIEKIEKEELIKHLKKRTNNKELIEIITQKINNNEITIKDDIQKEIYSLRRHSGTVENHSSTERLVGGMPIDKYGGRDDYDKWKDVYGW